MNVCLRMQYEVGKREMHYYAVLLSSAVAASSYAASNPSHMSKRGSSGRSSARLRTVSSPMSPVSHSVSSGMYLPALLMPYSFTFQLQPNFMDITCLLIVVVLFDVYKVKLWSQNG